MNFLLRCPLVSIAALTGYLVVNLGAAALHHHHGEGAWDTSPTACPAAVQWKPAGPADDDDDGEENCLLCSVLYLARILPTLFHVEAVSTLPGEAVWAVAISCPCPLETTTHARAPPVS